MCISESFYYPHGSRQSTCFHVNFKTCQSLILGRQLCQSSLDNMRLNSFFFLYACAALAFGPPRCLSKHMNACEPVYIQSTFPEPYTLHDVLEKIWSQHLSCDVSDPLPVREEASPNLFISSPAVIQGGHFLAPIYMDCPSQVLVGGPLLTGATQPVKFTVMPLALVPAVSEVNLKLRQPKCQINCQPRGILVLCSLFVELMEHS